MDEQLTSSAEVISLTLTLPAVVLSTWVVVIWGPKAWVALKLNANKRTDLDWLILGIAVGFLGGVIDNTYWGVAWSLQYIESDCADWWFTHGAFPNIVARQAAGAYAAYCHLRGFWTSIKERHNRLAIMCIASLIAGIIYVLGLSIIRS